MPAATGRPPWSTVAAVSAGGVAGSLARYGLGVAFPVRPGGFPWATFAVNVSGCLLIGVLMVVITEATRPHPLARPFLGVGVLGGFTTFSGYVVDIGRTFGAGAPVTAVAYLAGTAAAALAAVYAGAAATRAAVARTSRRKGSP
ncbi:CrcB family protein [Sphaerisporangium sp. B11E5]|uniref:fluoride efflux transporter FluC n=1 Tax=Sphaerisporangium sp. B11E5 TaxID=3153563 RepID=UPI00325DA225